MHATLHNLRGLALGVLNGALYSAVQFLVVSAYFDYRIKTSLDIAQDLGLPQMHATELINARIVSIWFILFFALASVLGHRYLLKLKRQPVLFWEVIGLAAVVGWNVVVLTLFWLSALQTGQTYSLQFVTSPANPLFGPISMGVVIITNFIYGAVMTIMDRRLRSDEQERHPEFVNHTN